MNNQAPSAKQTSSKIGITMGCPVGIGPEVILKAIVHSPDLIEKIMVIGDGQIMRKAADITGFSGDIVNISSPEEFETGKLNVLCKTQLDPDTMKWGNPNSVTGKASYTYIETGIDLALKSRIKAIATAPISKIGLKMAQIDYPGHTEILADQTGTKNYAMMLAGRHLKVVLVTIHCAIKDVPGLISTEKILSLLKLVDLSLKSDMGIETPRIAVCGLNPHAGEQGMFGDEEERIIMPAIKQAQESGILAEGPFPPDTIFYRASRGEFDVVLCQYHDQGLIPLKLLHFRDGVNITLGLPIIRTSVDHGTGYDIAGKNIADPSSMLEAINMAEMMSDRRRNCV